MSRLIPDERIFFIEQLDRAHCVLVDAHSLATLDSAFEDPARPSTIAPSDFVTHPRGPWMAHIIQTLVLYDVVLADSVLFEVESAVTDAHKLFPDAIKGIFIHDSTRKRVGERVETAALDAPFGPPPDTPAEIWEHWLRLDSSEKPLFDKISENPPRRVPVDFASDAELRLFLDRENPVWLGMPLYALDSMMTTARAHFYLELARELRVPLNIDPIRAKYLDSLLTNAKEALTTRQDPRAHRTPEKAVEEFESHFELPDNAIVSFDVTIPPVPEYVLKVAQAEGISLYEATKEVRDSPNARNFRDWCATVFKLGEEGVPRAKGERNSMIKDFTRWCEAWANDASEGVDYRTRTLRLGDIPLVGKILKAAGMDEIVVRDPVITPDKEYRYFLFLNDLLRLPRRRQSDKALS